MSATTDSSASPVWRTPIIAVLGHVDAGKTSFLDKIRSTNVAAKEAGFITQHIGATEVPISIIQQIAGDLTQKFGFNLRIPGLLFIDTPGHEAFTNLRERGSSIADLAVLVVDLHKGLQPQSKEAITILREYKVPFVVALSKLDLLDGYESKPGSFLANRAVQDEKTKQKLDEKLYTIVGQLFEAGFQSEEFDRVSDTTKELALLPFSSQSGEGLPEILVFLAGLSQKFLEQNLNVHADGAGKGTVLEVREEKGLGMTLDVILYDGVLRVNDPIVVAGKNGVIQTKVRALFRPNTMADIRVADKFIAVKEAHAATGVKIAAPNLESALAGSPLLVEKTGKEKDEIAAEVNRIKVDSAQIGVIIKTDTLGSLEALVKLFQAHKIPITRADVGEITRRDILEAAAIKAKDPYLGVIFGFNSHVHPDARKDAELQKIKLFDSNIVYTLTQDYTKWVEEHKRTATQELLSRITYPVKLQVLPGFIFRNSKPAVVGARILEGKLKMNTQVMNEKGEVIGKVLAIQSENKSVEEAARGEEVAISIDGAVVDRNLFPNDILYSFLTPNVRVALQKLENSMTAEDQELLARIDALQSSIDDRPGGVAG